METMEQQAARELARPAASRWLGQIEAEIQSAHELLRRVAAKLEVNFEASAEEPEIERIETHVRAAAGHLDLIEISDGFDALWQRIRVEQRRAPNT